MYGDINILDLNCTLSYTLPYSADIQSCKLLPEKELYKDKIQYIWNITNAITKSSGNIIVRLSFSDNNSNIIRITLSTIIPIYTKSLITSSSNISEDILNLISNIQDSLSTKATDISIVDNSITLSANGLSIGTPIKISDIVSGLDETLKDYSVMINKPIINGTILEGTKTLEDLGLEEITNMDIEEMIKKLGGL